MPDPSPPRGRRSWWVVLGVVAAAAFLAWRAIELFADIDRYRPDAEALLSEAIGKPVTIGELDLAWRPIPCVSALDVRAGEGDLEATATRVDLYPDVLALLSRRVDIVQISVRNLVVTVPPDTEEIERGWSEIGAALDAAFAGDGEAEAEPSAWTVAVHRVETEDARIRLGAESPFLMTTRVVVDGIDSDALDLELDTDFPDFEAHAEGAFVIPLVETPDGGVRGHLEISRLRPYRWVDLPERLRSSVRARFEIASEQWDAFQIALTGVFEPDEEGAVGGSFESNARIDADANASGVLHVTSDDFSIDADAKWVDDALEIARFEAGPITVRGTIRPTRERGGVNLDLAGQIEIADAWLHALGVPPSLRDTRGTLVVEKIAGHFPPGPDTEPVVVEAHLVDGAANISTDTVDDAFSELSIRITSRDRNVTIEGGGRSRQMGRLTTKAFVVPDVRTARGELTFDAGTVATYISDGEVRERVEPLLRRTGETRIDFRLAPVPDVEDVYSLRVETTEETLPGHATITLHTDGESAVLGEIRARVAVSGETVNDFLDRPARFGGQATLIGWRSVADGTLTLDADLANMTITTDGFVDKRRDEPLALRVAGTSDWELRQLVVTSREGRIAFDLREGGLVAPDLDIELSQWDHLLVDTARASGSVRGSIDGPASRLRLELTEVALHVTDDIGVDAIDGAVALDGDDWSVSNLRIRGARSDATLDASLSKGVLDGRLSGANLDLDFVEALVSEVDALLPDGGDDDGDPVLESGKLAIDLDRIGYRRSEAKAVKASVSVVEGDIAIRDLTLETYEGRVSGTVGVDARDEAPSLFAMEIDIADVTGRFLDDAFFDPPRQITGRFTGKLAFEAPLHDDTKATLADGNGRLTVKSLDGSFGKLGIATKLITVVRSSEALRAKLPSMSDEGLVYDVFEADLVMKDGRVDVALLDIDSHSYTIDATGFLDFRKDESKVPIEANLIKGLSGVVRWIPVAGRALEIVNVRMVATGSPYDLKVGIASFTDQLLGAGRAGAGAIIGDATDALRILGGAMGGNGRGATPAAPSAGAPTADVTPAEVPTADATPEEAPAEPGGPEAEVPAAPATQTPPEIDAAAPVEPAMEPVDGVAEAPEQPAAPDSPPVSGDESDATASETTPATPREPEDDEDGTERTPEEAL